MAYIVLLKGPSSLTPTSRNFYNLDNTVGAGGVNKIDDVMLVQALVNIVIGPTVRDFNKDAYFKALKVDGVCDSKTTFWVTYLQYYTSDLGFYSGKIDSLLRPMDDDFVARYPMFCLNETAWDGDDLAHSELPMAAGTPGVLKKALQVSRTESWSNK